MPNDSVFRVVILSMGGVGLAVDELLQLPGAHVLRAEIARIGPAGCAALLVRSSRPEAEWLAAARRWAAARDWMVTVASRTVRG